MNVAIESHPIVVRISDGLGNQMFQYAAARALALRLGVPLKLDLSCYATNKLRKYGLGAYPIEAEEASDTDLSGYFSRWHRRRLVHRLVVEWNRRRPFESRRIVEEKSHRFDPRLLTIQHPVFLAGFWQCEKYFEAASDTIRRDLTLQTGVPTHYQSIAAEIENSPSVALLVRRGDYVGNQNAEGICNLSYYQRALQLIAGKAGAVKVFVFSDDIPWCISNVKLNAAIVFVKNPRPDEPHEYLRLFSACRHFVLANSSYAWWGAWLSSHADKVVVGPARWMQVAEPCADILPAHWLRVAND